MSNQDYKQSASGAFATFVKTDVTLSETASVIDYTDFNFDSPDPIQVGDAAMVDEEIMRIETVGIRTFSVKRGCADTIPAPHAAGSLVWIFSRNTGNVGTDGVERSAGETASVKVTPFTVGGGSMPLSAVAPVPVTFNWRFFRPYPPAHLFANSARWYSGAAINDTTGSMNLTWYHRNRVVQADQLVGHDDASIAPELDTTYVLEIYNAANALLRTEYGIIGTTFMYQQAKALHDFGNPSSPVEGYAKFYSVRQDMESWQAYTIPMHIEPSANPIASQWQAFDQRVIESPYIWNRRKSQNANGAYSVSMAARPADRMSDDYELVKRWVTSEDSGEVDENEDPIYVDVIHHQTVADGDYLPWLTNEFTLRELEVTFTIRSSSLYDGVKPHDLAGMLGLIEDELVEIVSYNHDSGTLTLNRGVGDTIPANHIAGSRLWLFDPNAVQDPTDHSGSAPIDYRFVPGVFGPPVSPEVVPANNLSFNTRALRPYPAGQVMADARPWFEEAVMESGIPLYISWTWRNRITQGSEAYAHGYPSFEPEAGTQAVLTFFYEQPPGVEHVLRTITVDPIIIPTEGGIQDGDFQYSYANAVTDGNTAGTAQGVCGTTVIKCRLSMQRSGYTSLQSYVIPIRVPSYPCT